MKLCVSCQVEKSITEYYTNSRKCKGCVCKRGRDKRKEFLKLKIYSIYKITNLVSSKVYIGQTIEMVNTRIKDHLRELRKNTHSNSHLQYSFNKYGESNFIFEKIDETNSFDSLDQLERFYIKLLKANNPEYGFNKTSGGCENHVFNESSNLKKSKSRSGILHTEEAKAKISRAGKGRTVSWNRGMKGVYKLGPASEERKKKIGEAQLGPKNHRWGKKSGETHLKSVSKPIICINTGIEYPSMSEASRKLSVSISSISKVCMGEASSCKGLIFIIKKD